MLTFAVSWLGTTMLGLQHDLYDLIYFTFALGYLTVFARRRGVALREVLRCPAPRRSVVVPADHAMVLPTQGIDVAEIPRRAQEIFGADALTRQRHRRVPSGQGGRCAVGSRAMRPCRAATADGRLAS
jgi:hypothetical protein